MHSHRSLYLNGYLLDLQNRHWILPIPPALVRFVRSLEHPLVLPSCTLPVPICLPSKACSTLTASLALVSKYGIPPFDWQKVMALFDDIILLFSSTSILLPSTTYLKYQLWDSLKGHHIRRGNFQDPEGSPESRIRLSNCPMCQNSLNCLRHRQVRSSRRPCKKQRPTTGTVPALQCPKALAWCERQSE